VRLSLKGPFKGDVPLPLQFEYLDAGARTTFHGDESSTTVSYQLPLMVIGIAPMITFGSHDRFYFQGGVTVAWLANLAPLPRAVITVTDRSGYQSATGADMGSFGRLGLLLKRSNRTHFALDVGMRFLQIDDVQLEPHEGFTASPGGALTRPGRLPQSLDYSAFLFRVGLRWIP
jgi:hypothetical protein